MKMGRETILLAGVFLLLAVFTGLAAVFQARPTPKPALSSLSDAPDGARAIYLWLSEAGYAVDNQTGDQFAIPAGTDVVLILQPNFDFSRDEWTTLDTWVRQGGELLLAASRWEVSFSGNPFNLSTSKTTLKEYDLFPTVPIFRSPPLVQPAHLTIDRVLNYSGADGLPLFTIEPGPAAWQIPLGKGKLIAVSDASFLTNAGLKNVGNAELAINLFSQIPGGSKVLFDEWHHGERANHPIGYGLTAWLTQTPAGFAVLFTALVIFLGLVLAGRPFGQRVPLVKNQIRRGTLDYVNALANLNRRAGHRQAVMSYYYGELKRAFGKRYRLDLDQPDQDFIHQAMLVNPALERAGLNELLRRLRQKNFSETEMVQLARECAGWIDRIEHR